MTKETSNADIAVYLGAVFEHDSEERFLNRLRRDLARRGTNALILANFQARANNEQRQIDFLVLTDARLSHVELKALNPGAPVTGPLNGPWIQDLGGGRNSSIEPNPFFQAQNGTFAISDVAGRVMNSGKAPVSKPFFKQIDSVVCLDPGIPEGSTFERHTYVDVVGYNDLLTRIEAPGHRPPWLPEHWDAFIDALGLQKEEYFSPTERRRRESVEALAGYRQHFVERTTANLGAFVEIPFRFGEERMTFAESLDWIASGTSVGLIGKSGFGKSRAARECALVLTERERLVIWLDCGEYEKGDLRTLLSWSMAPFSTETPGRLAEHAGRIADQIVIVLDGFNECPPSLRGDLVTELDSFRLRFPSNLLVTSTVELPSGLVDEVLVAELPDAEQRASILASHGARDVDRVSEAFATPFELAVVALCDAELGPDATGAELYRRVRSAARTERIDPQRDAGSGALDGRRIPYLAASGRRCRHLGRCIGPGAGARGGRRRPRLPVASCQPGPRPLQPRADWALPRRRGRRVQRRVKCRACRGTGSRTPIGVALVRLGP